MLKLGKDEEIKEFHFYMAPGWSDDITDNSTVRVLSVIVNSDFNYSDHVAKVYSKVFQRAVVLLRTLKNRSSTSTHLKFLWKTYL